MVQMIMDVLPGLKDYMINSAITASVNTAAIIIITVF